MYEQLLTYINYSKSGHRVPMASGSPPPARLINHFTRDNRTLADNSTKKHSINHLNMEVFFCTSLEFRVFVRIKASPHCSVTLKV